MPALKFARLARSNICKNGDMRLQVLNWDKDMCAARKLSRKGALCIVPPKHAWPQVHSRCKTAAHCRQISGS